MEEPKGKSYNQLWKDSNFTIGDLPSEVKYRPCDDLHYGGFKNPETTHGFMNASIVPVINGCDNTFHPTQALADMLTLYEKTGHFDVKVLYIGAKNNTYNSLSEIVTMLGGKMYGLTPFSQVMGVGDEFYEGLKATGHYEELPDNISKEDLKKVVADVDCVYTDTWVDMEFFTNPDYADKKNKIISMMMPYQIDADLMAGIDERLHDMPIPSKKLPRM